MHQKAIRVAAEVAGSVAPVQCRTAAPPAPIAPNNLACLKAVGCCLAVPEVIVAYACLHSTTENVAQLFANNRKQYIGIETSQMPYLLIIKQILPSQSA
jgi:hypothetical protein